MSTNVIAQSWRRPKNEKNLLWRDIIHKKINQGQNNGSPEFQKNLKCLYNQPFHSGQKFIAFVYICVQYERKYN